MDIKSEYILKIFRLSNYSSYSSVVRKYFLSLQGCLTSNAKGKKKSEELYSDQGVNLALPSSWWKKTGNYEESPHWQMLGLAAAAPEGVSVKSGRFDSEIQCFLIYVRTSVSHSICVCVCACMLNCVWLFVAPWTIACRAPQSMGFSKQENSSGLSFPSPGNFPTQGLNPCFLGFLHWQADSLPLSHLGSPSAGHPSIEEGNMGTSPCLLDRSGRRFSR